MAVTTALGVHGMCDTVLSFAPDKRVRRRVLNSPLRGEDAESGGRGNRPFAPRDVK